MLLIISIRKSKILMLGCKRLIQKYNLFRFCKITYLKYEGKNDFLERNEISSFAMGFP